MAISVGRGIGAGLTALGGFLHENVIERKQERLAWAKEALAQRAQWSKEDYDHAMIEINKTQNAIQDKLANSTVSLNSATIAKMGNELNDKLTVVAKQLLLDKETELAKIAAQGKVNKELQAQADEVRKNIAELEQNGANFRAVLTSSAEVKAAAIAGASRPTSTMVDLESGTRVTTGTPAEDIASGAQKIMSRMAPSPGTTAQVGSGTIPNTMSSISALAGVWGPPEVQQYKEHKLSGGEDSDIAVELYNAKLFLSIDAALEHIRQQAKANRL